MGIYSKMSGQEVLVELQRLDPAVKVMVFSGYAPAADKIYGQVMAVVETPPPPEKFPKQVRAIIAVKPA